MSICFSVYFSFADRQVPNYFGLWELFESAGMEFQPSGYYCLLSQEGILETPGNVVKDLSSFSCLTPEMKANLLQQWEHSEGGGVALGFVRSGSVMIGVLRFLSSDVDALSQTFTGTKYEFPQFLILSMSTLGAIRLLAGSDTSVTDNIALALLLEPDFGACLELSGVSGFGVTHPEGGGQSCPSNFKDFSTENTTLWFHWPFD